MKDEDNNPQFSRLAARSGGQPSRTWIAGPGVGGGGYQTGSYPAPGVGGQTKFAPVSVPAPQPPELDFRHRDNLDLPDDLVGRINALRSDVGDGFVVTSGRRDASRQAAAMYHKFQTGHVPNYVNKKAFAEVKQAYENGAMQNLGPSDITNAMTKVLQNQMDAGVFLSKHQTSKAMDISRALTRQHWT